MSKVSDEADEMGTSTKKAGKVGGAAIAGLATAIGTAVTATGALVAKSAEYARQVEQAAAQSGIAAEAIQEIAFAAKQTSGASFDTVRDGLKELAIRSEEAAQGTGEAAEAFDRLGISQEFLQESSPAETFRRVRQELQGASKRMRIFAAETIFGGEAGEKLVQTLGLSSEEMSRLRAEARKSGAVLSGSQVAALENARSAWSSFTSTLMGTGRQLGARLAPLFTSTVIPALRSMTESVRSAAKAVTSMSDTTKGVAAVVTGLTAAVSAGLAAWGAWPAIIGAVTAGFSGLATAAGAAWAAITSPVTGVIAATAAVAGAAGLIYDNWGALSGFFSTQMDAVVSVVRYYGAVIADFFSGLWVDVKQIFVEGINGLISTINEGLRAIGQEDMTIDTIGVPEEAVRANRRRMERLRKEMQTATSKANEAIEGSFSDAWAGVEKSTSDAISFVQGQLADLGGLFSVGTAGGQQQTSTATSGSSGGAGGGRTGSASAGQEETLIPQPMPNLNADLKLAVSFMTQLKRVGKTAAASVGRGFARVNRQLGTTLSSVITGRDTFQSFGQVATRAIGDVIAELTTMITKLGVVKGLSSAFGLGTGITSFGGLFSSLIPGLAKGGMVTQPGIARVHKGEAVLPQRLTEKLKGPAMAGGTIKGKGGRIAQGMIEIPVEVVDQAQRRGSKNLSRTGR